MALSIPWFNRGGTKAGRVGLLIAPEGVCLVQFNQHGKLVHCGFYRREADAAAQLQVLVDSRQLKDTPCTIVLDPGYYQLLLAEAPPVEGSEMSQAVRWKIKELLEFPLEEAAIEHFLLPDDAYRGRQKMLYAAALRKSELQNLVAPVEATGLQVDCVEIAELALNNLVSRLPKDPGGVALLQLQGAGGFINLVEDGAIYLSRRLDVGLKSYNPVADNSKFFDALFLEIQRSLDFYESQVGKGIITQLWYCPGLPYTADIGTFLSSQLGLNVSALDLSPLQLADVIDEELDEQISLCVSAIGGALGPLPDSEAKELASAAS